MIELLKYPDKVLLTPAEDFIFTTDRPLLKEFEEAIRKGFGWGELLGMAAPQLNIPKRFFVALRKLYINPTITQRSKETYEAKEGCYSLEKGKYDYKVERNAWIILKWQDRGGNWHEKKFDGFRAQVLQHEYDHLMGKLCCN